MAALIATAENRQHLEAPLILLLPRRQPAALAVELLERGIGGGVQPVQGDLGMVGPPVLSGLALGAHQRRVVISRRAQLAGEREVHADVELRRLE